MKIYRTIGTVLSSFLTFIFIILLTLSMTLLSAARVVTKETVSNLTKTLLQNEAVRNEISAQLSSAVSGFTLDLSNSIQQDDAENTVVIEISQEHLDKILSMPEVQTALGNIISDYTMVIVDQNQEAPVSASEQLEAMLYENPLAFSEQIASILPEYDLTYDDFYEATSSIAMEHKLSMPEYGANYSEIVSVLVSANSAEIDKMIEDVIAQYLPSELSYHASSDRNALMSISKAMPLLSATSPAGKNVSALQSDLSILSEALAILQDPSVYISLISFVLIFFLLTALLTWSLFRPTLFLGIAAIISGILMIIITQITPPFYMIAQSITEQFSQSSVALTSTVSQIMMSIWYNITASISTHGIITLASGITLILIFTLICIIRYRLKKADEEGAYETNYFNPYAPV